MHLSKEFFFSPKSRNETLLFLRETKTTLRIEFFFRGGRVKIIFKEHLKDPNLTRNIYSFCVSFRVTCRLLLLDRVVVALLRPSHTSFTSHMTSIISLFPFARKALQNAISLPNTELTKTLNETSQISKEFLEPKVSFHSHSHRLRSSTLYILMVIIIKVEEYEDCKLKVEMYCNLSDDEAL